MIRTFRREWSVAVATAVALGVMAGLRPEFFAAGNLRNLLVSRAPVLVAAIGMTLVILARQIDISIGSQFAISGVMASLLARAGWPLPLVLGGTLGVGALLGAANGALVAGLEMPSIVVTLATQVSFEQGIRWATGGEPVVPPASFQWLGLSQAAGEAGVLGLTAGLFLLFAGGLRWLRAGRAVYATGSDPEAARLVGIRPRRVFFGVFLMMGMLTSLSALLSTIQSTQADPTSGQGLELEVIAAVVVGGASILGGRGTLPGTLLGVVLLGLIGPALVFLRVEAAWEKAVQGAIILVAVAFDALNLRRKRNVGASLAAR